MGILRNRLDAHVLPHFRDIRPSQIKARDLDAVVQRLTAQNMSTTTISQYLVIVRKLLKLARKQELIRDLPEMPQVKSPTGRGPCSRWASTAEWCRPPCV